MQRRKQVDFIQRLWAMVLIKGPDECWPWQGTTAGKGYGALKKLVNEKWRSVYAHREILILKSGLPIAPNDHALHSCDSPSCCNPAHLSWGSNSKNRREARDRLNNQGNQKLTKEQVNLIKQDSRPYRVIAQDYGVHFDTIARIHQGRSWHPSDSNNTLLQEINNGK